MRKIVYTTLFHKHEIKARMNYKLTLEQVKDYVVAYFEMHPNPKLVYHNLEHTKEVVKNTTQIANHYQLSDKDFFIVITSAWFHDTGYIIDLGNHEEKGAQLASDFLKKIGAPADVRDAVVQTILSTKMPQKPTNLLESIICDGDLFHLGGENFNDWAKLMRKEGVELYGVKISKKDWARRNIEFLQNHEYHTDYVILLLNDQKQKNIDKLKAKLDESEEGDVDGPLPIATEDSGQLSKADKKKLEKEKPSKGIETMFRITSANNQRLSDMADNKAQLLLTVNSIIISLIVSLVLRRLEDNAFLVIPTLILLLVSLSCVIFSILATRPTIPEGYFTDNDLDRKKVNLLFFGNFYNMALGDYSKGMNRVMNDKVFLYETLITDVYSQGVVLGRKYKLIRIAYNIFMFGLIAAVLSYIVTYIAYGKLS